MELRIRAAHPDDVERLREIAFAAKGHWGYDSARVRQWADTYDFCALLHSHTVFVAQAGDANLAWASLSSPDGGVAVLDDLWVDPAWMGKGVGSRLFYAHASMPARSGPYRSRGRPIRTPSVSTSAWAERACANNSETGDAPYPSWASTSTTHRLARNAFGGVGTADRTAIPSARVRIVTVGVVIAHVIEGVSDCAIGARRHRVREHQIVPARARA